VRRERSTTRRAALLGVRLPNIQPTSTDNFLGALCEYCRQQMIGRLVIEELKN